ncbi:MAG: DUF3291 domain-containing protein [Bacteroidota bacterium]
MGQITTISFFQFDSLWAKIWAFGMMQFAHKRIQKVQGLEFYKLMGTGKARFNPMPDWSVYTILQIWKDDGTAEAYFSSASIFKKYQNTASKHWVVYLKNRIARGEWNGTNPFERSKEIDERIPFVVALTRATIKTKLLLTFWRFVPKSQNHLWNNEGLLFTKGIGEVPFRQMATFSLWKDEKSLDAFAYQTRGHVSAIGKTRDLNWYKEELFARFQPYKSVGDWAELSQLLPFNQ